MRFRQLVDYAFEVWLHALEEGVPPTTLFVMGPPGIGKTAGAHALADRMSEYMQGRYPTAASAVKGFFDTSSMMPEEVPGMPFVLHREDSERAQTAYAPLRRMYGLLDPDAYGVLCWDDLPASMPAVQTAVRQAVLDHRIHDHLFSPKVMCIVTGNRREDKANATSLPSHFRNSVHIVTVEPEVEEWCEWYGAQPNCAPILGSFVRYRPKFLSQLPKDEDQMGCFATPRSWAKLGRVYDVAWRRGMLLEVAGGYVGSGVAAELEAFANIRAQLVDPVSVLRDPEKALPDPKGSLSSPDRAYALTTGIGEIAAQWVTGTDPERRKKAPLALMRAIGWVTQGSREYTAVAVSTYTANGGKVQHLIQAARANIKDPLVKSVIQFLEAAFTEK